jgi:hypothetical protein
MARNPIESGRSTGAFNARPSGLNRLGARDFEEAARPLIHN